MPVRPPTETLYGTHGSGAAESYERHIVPTIAEPVARRLVNAARPARGERVLDVACGTGIVGRLALPSVGSEGRVVGIDANVDMLDIARSITDDVDWLKATAERILLPEGAFDLVLCSMGLQFFRDKEQALREMGRMLAPTGRALWCTPGPTPPLFVAIADAITIHLGAEASQFIHAVFSLHDADVARGLMDAAGFDDVDIKTTWVPMRVPPPVHLLWQYVNSTPLATAAAALRDEERTALEAEVVDRCAPLVDRDASILEPSLLIVTGRRSQ